MKFIINEIEIESTEKKTKKYVLMGIAIKVLDGNQRAIEVATMAILNHLEELRVMEKEFFIKKKNRCFLIFVYKDKSFDRTAKGDFNLKNNLINRKDKENFKYIYTGVQILTPNVFDHLDLKVFSINKIWDQLIQNNDLFAKISNIDFLHVSNLNIYKSLLEKNFKR